MERNVFEIVKELKVLSDAIRIWEIFNFKDFENFNFKEKEILLIKFIIEKFTKNFYKYYININ